MSEKAVRLTTKQMERMVQLAHTRIQDLEQERNRALARCNQLEIALTNWLAAQERLDDTKLEQMYPMYTDSELRPVRQAQKRAREVLEDKNNDHERDDSNE